MRKAHIFMFIGACIFLVFLMIQVGVSTFNESLKVTKIKPQYGVVESIEKTVAYTTDSEGHTYTHYNSDFVVVVDNEKLSFSTDSRDIYKSVNEKSKIVVYEYKGKYSLSDEEFILPTKVKLITGIGMAVGVSIAAFPFLASYGRYSRRRY